MTDDDDLLARAFEAMMALGTSDWIYGEMGKGAIGICRRHRHNLFSPHSDFRQWRMKLDRETAGLSGGRRSVALPRIQYSAKR